MSHSAPQSIADTTLGLTPSELQIFRQQSQVLAQQRAQQETAAGRGRGTSRHSNPSSRAASAASSQGGQGRVFLDPRSLQTLHTHFDNLMRTITGRIEALEDATQTSVQASTNRSRDAMGYADEQIARMRRIMAEIDQLEADLDRVKNIRNAVKQKRARVDEMSARLERSQPSSHNHNHNSSQRPISGHNSSGRHAPNRR